MFIWKNTVRGNGFESYTIAAHEGGDIVECVRKYMDEISQNLQGLSSY